MATRAWYMSGLGFISGTLIVILGRGNVIVKLGWKSIESVG
jgi:hypothetical protein